MQDLPIEIDIHSMKSLLDGDVNCLLLDCRNQDEYERVHIAGCHWIPMNELQQRVGELGDHRTKRVVVYCHLGVRSLRVANWLRQQGFAQAQSMTGGVDAWAEQIDPRLPRY